MESVSREVHDTGLGESETAENETLNQVAAFAERMLAEGMDMEHVSNEALFKTPSIKRKSPKANADKEKHNQLIETQADKNRVGCNMLQSNVLL